jgi:hypothetical protein
MYAECLIPVGYDCWQNFTDAKGAGNHPFASAAAGEPTDRRRSILIPPSGAVTGTPACSRDYRCAGTERNSMNGLIYLIGLIVVIMAILSFLGLR